MKLRLLQRPSFSTFSLGQFLESREPYLKSLDRRVGERNAQARRKKALEDAYMHAVSAQEDVLSAVKTPQLSLAEITGPTARDEFTLKTMLDCGMHLGHSTARWNPRMAPFIFGTRNDIHILDLEKTLACLRQAAQVARDFGKNPNASILFVGCHTKIKRLAYECATSAGQYYVNTRWTAGTLTNASSVLGNQLALHHALGADPHGPAHRPSLLILLEYNETAVREAERVHVPTIAICDTNSDPTLITYPIPANDDAFASVELIARILAEAARRGRELRLKPMTLDEKIADSAHRFAVNALDQLHPGLFH